MPSRDWNFVSTAHSLGENTNQLEDNTQGNQTVKYTDPKALAQNIDNGFHGDDGAKAVKNFDKLKENIAAYNQTNGQQGTPDYLIPNYIDANGKTIIPTDKSHKLTAAPEMIPASTASNQQLYAAHLVQAAYKYNLAGTRESLKDGSGTTDKESDIQASVDSTHRMFFDPKIKD